MQFHEDMSNDINCQMESLLHDGIRIKKVKLSAISDTDRGLIAVSQIKPGDTLITVPTRHLLNLKTIGAEVGFNWKE